MLGETELAKLLVSWRNQMGEEIKGRMCVPTDNVLRTEMYKNLIKTLIELHGYTQEDLGSNTYRRVMEASINPNSEKAEKWRKIATDNWNDAMDTFFPQTLLVHDSSGEPKRPKREAKEYKKSSYADDAPVTLDNPINKKKLNTGIPVPKYVIDEDLLKELKGNSDE